MSIKQVQRLRNIKPVLALTAWVNPANKEGMYQPAQTITAYPGALSSLVVLQAGSESFPHAPTSADGTFRPASNKILHSLRAKDMYWNHPG